MKALLAVLLLASCRGVAPDTEVAIHVRRGGAECMAPCFVRGVNLTAQECGEFRAFIPRYTGAIARYTDIPEGKVCQMLYAHDVVVVDADPEGAFKLGKHWVDGATDCADHLTFVGLPPGDPGSAAAHELTHVLDCQLRSDTNSNSHAGWQTNGFCEAVHEVSTLPDDCK